MVKRNTKAVTFIDVPAAKRERLEKILVPQLGDVYNRVLSNVASFQGRDKPLRASQMTLYEQHFVKELIMDGWLVETEQGYLLLLDGVMQEHGIWVPVEDCGCGK